MKAQEIKDVLFNSYTYSSSVCVPEFTWNDLRADAIILDIKKRWIRAFEIKVSRSDFLQDDKWVMYSQFCSSLSVVCPENLIQPNEIEKPFGLLWVLPEDNLTSDYRNKRLLWKKKPQNFQKRNSLSWFWTYTKVLEREFLRLDFELHRNFK